MRKKHKPLNHSTKIEPIFIRPYFKKNRIDPRIKNIEDFRGKRGKKLKKEALLFKF